MAADVPAPGPEPAGSSAELPIPPIPDFDRIHGPASRFLLRRTLLGLGGLWAFGLALLVIDAAPVWKAFALGLLLPGGGQLYGGDTVAAAIALLAFPAALFLWWLCGNVLLPPLVWLGAAVLAPLRLDGDGEQWAIGVVLSVLLGLLIGGWAYQQARFRVQRARGRARNEVLRRVAPTLRSTPPQAGATEASEDDLKTLRYLMDLALQPSDQWDGFFFVRPEQFREGAVRYQLNFVSYAAAMYQYTRTPAFTGYAAEAQRNMIDRMLHKPVWSYWALENLWGNLRWNPDPIIDDNVMYSGYLGLMLGLYETTTGDQRYHEPGCLDMRWSKRTTFRHDFGSITDALVDNFARSRTGQFPCEPNWIYPMCNTFGVNSLLVYDRIRGSDHAGAVVEQVRDSYENGDYCEPDGRLTAARSEYFGFRHPMVGNMGDGITTYFLNPIVPDLGRRTWWLMENFHLDRDGRHGDPQHRSWNLLDPGNYGVFTDRFTRAVLAANAREYGDDAGADTLVASLADRIVEQDGARRYRGLSVWGNLYLALAQFGREDAFRGLVRDGLPEPWRTGPRLAEAAYPDVLVTYAVTDGTALDLVLRPGGEGGRTTLLIERLIAHRTYVVEGPPTTTLEADANGCALVEVDLTDRLELKIRPRI